MTFPVKDVVSGSAFSSVLPFLACDTVDYWREKCKDRRFWNEIVKQAKTHQGSTEEEEDTVNCGVPGFDTMHPNLHFCSPVKKY